MIPKKNNCFLCYMFSETSVIQHLYNDPTFSLINAGADPEKKLGGAPYIYILYMQMVQKVNIYLFKEPCLGHSCSWLLHTRNSSLATLLGCTGSLVYMASSISKTCQQLSPVVMIVQLGYRMTQKYCQKHGKFGKKK